MKEKWINPIDEAVTVLIPGGEFLMGSRYEQPLHRVFISDFRMGFRVLLEGP
jgi:formylglycine-generating enzyme required for sulfatase activity